MKTLPHIGCNAPPMHAGVLPEEVWTIPRYVIALSGEATNEPFGPSWGSSQTISAWVILSLCLQLFGRAKAYGGEREPQCTTCRDGFSAKKLVCCSIRGRGCTSGSLTAM